jgi:hypothetical protein
MHTLKNPYALIKSLKPTLNEGLYVFCTVKEIADIDISQVLCTFKEKEGTTLILRKDIADRTGLTYTYVAAWITITIQSSLDSVGLTAVMAEALANKGISCNVVAGYHHDHLFVHKDRADEAMKILNRLS